MCRPTTGFTALLALGVLLTASPRRAATQTQSATRSEFWGFTAPWDPRSDSSVRARGSQLSAVVTGWIGLDSATGRPLLPSVYPDSVLPRDGTAARMAIVTSWHGQGFHTRSVRRLARDPKALSATAGAIARYSRAMGYTGLIFDFETLERADLPGQLRVLRVLGDSARKRGVRVLAVAVPATDTGAYPARQLLRVVDFVIPMLYDQHWSGSTPGAVAASDWVRSSLALRVAEAGPDRIVAALPTYGYWWRRGRPTEAVGFQDARRIADSARVPITRDAATGALRATRGNEWDLWFTDAQLLAALVRQAEAAGVRRFAFWRLGWEDPALWSTVVR
ncbi:MAG: hypothetical protein ACRENU_12020 [Gemmatimonadaceae bacterium]